MSLFEAMVEAGANAICPYGRRSPFNSCCSTDSPYCIEHARIALTTALPILAERGPDTAMKRALLAHRGYDPDAEESTLDSLGQLDLATMHVFIEAHRAMLTALVQEAEGRPSLGVARSEPTKEGRSDDD